MSILHSCSRDGADHGLSPYKEETFTMGLTKRAFDSGSASSSFSGRSSASKSSSTCIYLKILSAPLAHLDLLVVVPLWLHQHHLRGSGYDEAMEVEARGTEGREASGKSRVCQKQFWVFKNIIIFLFFAWGNRIL